MPDLNGPGASLTTTAAGFRGTTETVRAVAAGKLRVVCSGDSFTLGVGVGDAENWCVQLSGFDDRLGTAKRGRGASGLDQVFFWYRRDGIGLEHQVQVLALIPHDIDRMEGPEFLGYRRPTLELVGDSLAVGNVPVPRQGFGAGCAAMAEPWRRSD